MNIGGMFRSLINPMTLAQLAMGPAGWASLAMRTLGTAIAQQVIQQLGQKLGLPQGVIDMAQTAFSAATGTQGMPNNIPDAVSQLAQQFAMSPAQQGNLERRASSLVDQWVKGALEGRDNGDESAVGASGARNGKADSFLVAFAKALGKAMDQKMNRMMDLSRDIDKETRSANSSGGKRQAVVGEMTAELQALGQEVSMISQAVANSIKSIGEANSTLARKG